MSNPALGVIFGNRDFFPDQLVTEARSDIQKLFKKMNIDAILLDENETKLGGVETYVDSKKCAELFRKKRDKIIGFLVVLPNFGDEKGIAETLKLADLNVPVLIQAYPDDLSEMNVVRRRDAFCGKISVCNNLKQSRIKFTLTTKHTVHPDDPSFQQDLSKFVSVCKVVSGLKNARLGAIGARPAAFKTVRYSEKLLEAHGISVTTVDLSEILGKAERLKDSDPVVAGKTKQIQSYANYGLVPEDKMALISKMGIVLNDFIKENELDATAIQCWSSLQENYGVNVCTNMSMMSENLIPSACEVDVTGALTMYAMQLASDSPSALADWNNNYGMEEDKVVMFHCGNWAKSFIPDGKISTAPILGTTLGEENTYGAMEGRTPGGVLTYGRISTDDLAGVIKTYVGSAELTDDPLDTFGTRAVARIPNLNRLMHYICNNGFEHHVVMNQSNTADILEEAYSNYLGWSVYRHGRES